MVKRTTRREFVVVLAFCLALFCSFPVPAGVGDWPEPRHNPQLTSIQPLPGRMKEAPAVLARYDLGRGQPSVQAVALPDDGYVGLAVVAGALHCYNPDGKLLWRSHPAGLNYSRLVAHGDFDGDGLAEAALEAGRPAQPYGAAVLVAVESGEVVWRHDVDPMSYSWKLHVGEYLPEKDGRQLVVLMHGYPPDKDNGYIALFEFVERERAPVQKWRYDFDLYTCFPSLLQTDLDGDGADEVVVETHSRMWFLDASTGEVKHFAKWDVPPANVRSYGHIEFVDLNGDGREDFLCIADFAQHHEVLLNKDGVMEKAWWYGWAESVTTGKVATKWPEPPYADVDGDGGLEVIVSMFNSEGENGWLLRVYDAVDGSFKYRFPGVIAVSVADITGDGQCSILANNASDASGTGEGAVLLRVENGQLEPVGHHSGRALAPRGDAPFVLTGIDGLYQLVERDGEIVGVGYEPPKPPPVPTFANLPEVKGDTMPALLAADLLGDGANEIVMHRRNSVHVLELRDANLNKVRSYEADCLPAIADLDGDGLRELVLVDVSPEERPRVKAVAPHGEGQMLWETVYPPTDRTGLPAPRGAYVRPGHFTGQPLPDLYLWLGTPVVRSSVLDGRNRTIYWDKDRSPVPERYHGPSVNLASVYDYNGDGKDDLVFTNPDYYCIADGLTGELLLGPLYPPNIFGQPSQGLYTLPAILEEEGKRPTVCLVDGHYFQAAMSIDAEPYWYHLPPLGENPCGAEGFLRTRDGAWLMGFGRQNGNFACVNVADGSTRWEFPVEASCSDVATCDVDGDGRLEFVFGTSHGMLHAIGDNSGSPRPVWSAGLDAGVGAPILADIDNDGATDIVVPTTDGYVKVLGPSE